MKHIGMAALLFLSSSAALAQETGATAPGFWSLLFDKGGLVTWVIALMSAVGLPVAGIKLYEFHKMDIYRPAELTGLLDDFRAGAQKNLAARLDGLAHPAAPLIAFAMIQANKGPLKGGLLREELTRNIWCGICRVIFGYWN